MPSLSIPLIVVNILSTILDALHEPFKHRATIPDAHFISPFFTCLITIPYEFIAFVTSINYSIHSFVFDGVGMPCPLFQNYKLVILLINFPFISIGSSNQIFPPWYWLIISLADSFFKPSNPIIWGIPGNFYLSFLQFFCISIGHTKSSIAIGHLLVPISKKNIQSWFIFSIMDSYLSFWLLYFGLLLRERRKLLLIQSSTLLRWLKV